MQFVLVFVHLVEIHIHTRTVFFLMVSDHIVCFVLIMFLICDYLWPFHVHDFSEEVSLDGVYFLFFIVG